MIKLNLEIEYGTEIVRNTKIGGQKVNYSLELPDEDLEIDEFFEQLFIPTLKASGFSDKLIEEYLNKKEKE